MDVEVVELVADRLEWAQGAALAEGHVVLTFGDQRITGERATWSGDTVVVERGTYSRSEGDVAFDRAELRLKDRTGTIAEVRARVGGATLEAGGLEVGERWTATNARLEPCQCTDGGPAALGFRAKRIEVIPDRVAILHGGTVRIFEVPVLPVPYWEEPLDPKRFRLLFPEVGYGSPGWSASWQGTGAVGDWRLTGGPAWRQDRGFRGMLQLDGPVDARGQLGWDWETDAVRGAGTTRAGFAGPVRAAWDLTGQTDETYADDYGVDWVARGVGYRESRAVAQWRWAQLRAHAADDGSISDLVQARIRPVFGQSAWVAPWAAGGVTAALPTWEDAETSFAPYAAGGVDGGASGTIGPVHGELRADAAVRYDVAPREAAHADGRAELPLWTEVGGRRIRVWPGVRATGAWDNALDYGVGPAVRAEAVLGDAVLTGDGTLAWGDDGWEPEGTVDVRWSKLSVWAHGSMDLQSGGLRWVAPLGGSVGALHTPWSALAWASLDLKVGRFITGGGSAVDLDPVTLSGASAYVGYDDGCSALRVTAALSPDRELPDLGLQVQWRK